ncbi:MAG: copper chaperone PCu(A)C [Cellvibrionaceae bacterium]
MKFLLMISSIFVSAILTSSFSYAHTHGHKEHSVIVQNPVIKTTPPGINNTAAYLHIKNNSDQDIALVKAESDIAQLVEIHEHTMNNGLMLMQKVESITIPANSFIEFKPGGYHIMFINLNSTISPDQKVEINLTFSNGMKQSITAIAVEQVKSSTHKMHKHH